MRHTDTYANAQLMLTEWDKENEFELVFPCPYQFQWIFIYYLSLSIYLFICTVLVQQFVKVAWYTAAPFKPLYRVNKISG